MVSYAHGRTHIQYRRVNRRRRRRISLLHIVSGKSWVEGEAKRMMIALLSGLAAVANYVQLVARK